MNRLTTTAHIYSWFRWVLG